MTDGGCPCILNEQGILLQQESQTRVLETNPSIIFGIKRLNSSPYKLHGF